MINLLLLAMMGSRVKKRDARVLLPALRRAGLAHNK